MDDGRLSVTPLAMASNLPLWSMTDMPGCRSRCRRSRHVQFKEKAGNPLINILSPLQREHKRPGARYSHCLPGWRHLSILNSACPCTRRTDILPPVPKSQRLKVLSSRTSTTWTVRIRALQILWGLSRIQEAYRSSRGARGSYSPNRYIYIYIAHLGDGVELKHSTASCH